MNNKLSDSSSLEDIVEAYCNAKKLPAPDREELLEVINQMRSTDDALVRMMHRTENKDE